MNIDISKESKNAFGRIFYRIAYNKILGIVEAEWFGSASKRDLEQALEEGLEVHERSQCAYRLNDNTGFTGPWADSVVWLEEVWLPRAYKAGIRYLAHIARADSFGSEAGNALMMGKIGASIAVKVFSNKEDALIWLKSKQRSLLKQ